MNTNSNQTPLQFTIGFTVLAALMIATRGNHFASVDMLPSASWAAFFLAGFYLRSLLALPALIALAGGLDVAAVLWGGVSADCFGPSYPFLALAYASLWLGGRWLSAVAAPNLASLFYVIGAVVVSSFVCHLFSSGSYYLLSGSFADPSFAEFAERIAKYYPRSLQTLTLYIATAYVIHVSTIVALNASNTPAKRT